MASSLTEVVNINKNAPAFLKANTTYNIQDNVTSSKPLNYIVSFTDESRTVYPNGLPTSFDKDVNGIWVRNQINSTVGTNVDIHGSLIITK